MTRMEFTERYVCAQNNYMQVLDCVGNMEFANRRMANFYSEGFAWITTPQGFDYWRRVSNRFIDAASGIYL